MSDLKNLIEQNKNTEEQIKEKLIELLDKNQYFQDKIKKANNFEYDYLSANDIMGVDIRVNCDWEKLDIDCPNELLIEAIEKCLEDHCLYYNARDKEVYQSTAEELWISTHEDKVILGNDWVKYYDDFHLWLLIEKHMEETGYFPGIYSQDYYGNVDEYKFDEKYYEKFPQESKLKLEKIEKYLDFYDLMNDCENDGYQDLDNMPEYAWELISKELKDICYSEDINIHEVKEITMDKIVLHIESPQDINDKSCKLVEASEHGWRMYDLTIKLTPNALHFIMSDTKPNQGGILEMSLLPI